MKTLTLRKGTTKLCEEFEFVLKNGGTWNLKTKNSYHTLIGGKDPIYTKLEGDDQFIAVEGKWEKIN